MCKKRGGARGGGAQGGRGSSLEKRKWEGHGKEWAREEEVGGALICGEPHTLTMQ